MKNKNIILSVSMASLLFIGCAEETISSPIEESVDKPVQYLEQDLFTGQFIDSAVEGLNYFCSTPTLKGFTNNKGRFTCLINDTVEFKIGNYSIGSTAVARTITPATLYPDNQQFKENTLRLLQTMDNDNNPDNGIIIDGTLSGLLNNANIDIPITSVDFENVTENLGGRVLVTVENALKHFEKTLNANTSTVNEVPKVVEDDVVTSSITPPIKEPIIDIKENNISSEIDSSDLDNDINSQQNILEETTDQKPKVIVNDTVKTTDDVTVVVDTIITRNGFLYEEIISPLTGRVWLDRNLGATQVCAAINDTSCYGGYYQWGRETDGHQLPDSVFLATESSNFDITNIGDEFIYMTWLINSDWVISPRGATRAAHWARIDGESVCPTGFRVPSISEIKEETGNFIDNGELDNFLKLPATGYRSYSKGEIVAPGKTIQLWSNTTDQSWTKFYSFGNFGQDKGQSNRSTGRPVRCIKN